MQASKIASAGDLPSLRWASKAKSIIIMPFFFTRPISMMTPTKPYTSRGNRKITSASSARTTGCFIGPARSSSAALVLVWSATARPSSKTNCRRSSPPSNATFRSSSSAGTATSLPASRRCARAPSISSPSRSPSAAWPRPSERRWTR